MTEHEEWTDRLSDYLDGELTTGERHAVESHLAGCAACAAVLEDLKAVTARAASLAQRPPQTDLWAGIGAQIEHDRARSNVSPFPVRSGRRIAFTMPQLAAASLLIAAVSGGLVWSVQRRTVSPIRPSTEARPAEVAASVSPAVDRDVVIAPVALADQQYDAAVADLERALKQGRGRLDASTIAIVEHNLTTIDEAIRQAREALTADPANSYLSGHLVEARRRKLDLLRRATALTSEMD
jgi:anti-sigma factor RsiW